MNRTKFLAPDFPLGKVLCLLRTAVDLALLLLLGGSARPLRLFGLVWKVTPRYSMVKGSRLIRLYELISEANARGIPGDVVECGVWNGGSGAILAAACLDGGKRAPRRGVWLFDSFQGLPKPGTRDGLSEQRDYFKGWNHGTTARVGEAFRRLRVPMDRVQVVPGWFEASLPGAGVGDIALLHIDADWYDSVKVVLENLYPKLVPRGYVVLDDYGMWKGCRHALEDYFREHGLGPPTVVRTGRIGAYLQKPQKES